MNIVHTGGNYMNDGISIAASSHIAYTENSNNSNYVDAQMLAYLGVANYQVVQDPNNSYIDHIDCWGKFLTPETILIRSVPESHSQYIPLEQTANYFSNLQNSYGRNFKVVRVMTPLNQPYTNSLILNDKIFVPLTNNSYYDNLALQVYETAMPGYRIFGVYNNTGNPWISDDALHCRTHELVDKHAIDISHTPLSYEIFFQDALFITANIFSRSNTPLDNDSLGVFYQINENEFQFSQMHPYNRLHEYYTVIEGLSTGDILKYYIFAKDINGKKSSHPFIGKPQAHEVTVIENNESPQIHYIEPQHNYSESKIIFNVQVISEIDISSVKIKFYLDNLESLVTEETMTNIYDDYYQFIYPIAFLDVKSINFKFEATNELLMVSTIPSTGWFIFNITNSENDLNIPKTSFITSVYPNPLKNNSNNIINLKINKDNNSQIHAELFNIKGQRLQTSQLLISNNETFFKISKPLKSGIYFLKVSDDYNININKLIILE
jgi:hypothetical protein